MRRQAILLLVGIMVAAPALVFVETTASSDPICPPILHPPLPCICEPECERSEDADRTALASA